MKTIVEGVQPMRKLMDGPDCPIHNKPVWLLSTINEWIYYCPACDKRYNREFQEMDNHP